MAEWSDFTHTTTRGDDDSLPFVVNNTDSEGKTVPEDLTGYAELWFSAKHKPADADADAVFVKKLSTGGIVLSAPKAGTGKVNLVPADTAVLTDDRTYRLYAEMQAKDDLGKIVTLAQGRLIVRPDLIQATS